MGKEGVAEGCLAIPIPLLSFVCALSFWLFCAAQNFRGMKLLLITETGFGILFNYIDTLFRSCSLLEQPSEVIWLEQNNHFHVMVGLINIKHL